MASEQSALPTPEPANGYAGAMHNSAIRTVAPALVFLALAACGSSPTSRPGPSHKPPQQSHADVSVHSETEDFLRQYAKTLRFSLGRPRTFTVAPGGDVLFLRSGPRSFVQDLYEFDSKTGKERVLLTAQQILGQ